MATDTENKETREPTPEELRAAAATLARKKSPARTEAARNAARAPRPSRQNVPLQEATKNAISTGQKAAWERKKAAGETIIQGRKPRPLDEIPCTCGGEGLNHKSTCPRGRIIRERQKAGKL